MSSKIIKYRSKLSARSVNQKFNRRNIPKRKRKTTISSISSDVWSKIKNIVSSMWDRIKNVAPKVYGISKEGIQKLLFLADKGVSSLLTNDVSIMLSRMINLFMATSGYEYMMPTDSKDGTRPINPPPGWGMITMSKTFYNWTGGNPNVEDRLKSERYVPIDVLDRKMKAYQIIYDETKETLDDDGNDTEAYEARLTADTIMNRFSKDNLAKYVFGGNMRELIKSGGDLASNDLDKIESLIFRLLAILVVYFGTENRMAINRKEIDEIKVKKTKTKLDDERREEKLVDDLVKEDEEKEKKDE